MTTQRCFFCKHPFLFSHVLSLDIAYCYRLSSVVCLSVHASHPHWTSTIVPVRLCIHSFRTQWQILAEVDWLSGLAFCHEQELDLENEVFPTVAQPPGTLILPTSTTLLTPVHSENDSRVNFMIVLTTDYCWRSWTCRIEAPYKFHVD